MITMRDFWLDEDPLEVPPAAFGTTAYWRWRSAKTLAQRLK